jgi:hypothetical protein
MINACFVHKNEYIDYVEGPYLPCPCCERTHAMLRAYIYHVLLVGFLLVVEEVVDGPGFAGHDAGSQGDPQHQQPLAGLNL